MAEIMSYYYFLNPSINLQPASKWCFYVVSLHILILNPLTKTQASRLQKIPIPVSLPFQNGTAFFCLQNINRSSYLSEIIPESYSFRAWYAMSIFHKYTLNCGNTSAWYIRFVLRFILILVDCVLVTFLRTVSFFYFPLSSINILSVYVYCVCISSWCHIRYVPLLLLENVDFRQNCQMK